MGGHHSRPSPPPPVYVDKTVQATSDAKNREATRLRLEDEQRKIQVNAANKKIQDEEKKFEEKTANLRKQLFEYKFGDKLHLASFKDLEISQIGNIRIAMF